MQELQDKYGDRGCSVIGFPCDQFGDFATGDDESTKKYCRIKYGVTFDLFSRIEVKGENASPFFKYLTSREIPPIGSGDIEWNFAKFVLDRRGRVVARFRPFVRPTSDELQQVVEQALAENI